MATSAAGPPGSKLGLEPLVKSLAAITAIFCVAGFLTTNAYLYTLGVSDFSLLRTRFVLTGVLTVIPLVLALVGGIDAAVDTAAFGGLGRHMSRASLWALAEMARAPMGAGRAPTPPPRQSRQSWHPWRTFRRQEGRIAVVGGQAGASPALDLARRPLLAAPPRWRERPGVRFSRAAGSVPGVLRPARHTGASPAITPSPEMRPAKGADGGGPRSTRASGP